MSYIKLNLVSFQNLCNFLLHLEWNPPLYQSNYFFLILMKILRKISPEYANTLKKYKTTGGWGLFRAHFMYVIFSTKSYQSLQNIRAYTSILINQIKGKKLHSWSLGSGPTGFWATETLDVVTLIIPKIQNA